MRRETVKRVANAIKIGLAWTLLAILGFAQVHGCTLRVLGYY